MTRIWIVFCNHCNTSTTEAVPPKRVDFIPIVQCSICNHEIDANNGHFASVTHGIIEPKYPDLLGVEQ